MKKTTYILIALVILPIVMVFLSPFFISAFFTESKGKYSSPEITLSKNMAKTATTPFECIEIDAESVGHTADVTVVVRQSPSYSVLLPENITDISNVDVAGNKLKIYIKNPNDDDYHYFNGDSLLIIECPNISSLRLLGLNRLKLEGFDCDHAMIDFDQDIYFERCAFGSLELKNTGALLLTDSRIRCAAVEAESRLRVNTSESAIDSMIVSSNRDHLKFSYGDANIGNIQIVPDGNTITLSLQNPATISNGNYGNND